MKKYLPGRAALAGGVGGLVAFALVLALNAAGVPVSSDMVMAFVAVALPVALSYVPPHARERIEQLDEAVRKLSQVDDGGRKAS